MVTSLFVNAWQSLEIPPVPEQLGLSADLALSNEKPQTGQLQGRNASY
jgi:hypothetical protein